MEATIVYWGYIGAMEKKMETTIVYSMFSLLAEPQVLFAFARKIP